jgi:hypothetical protein
MQGTDLQKGAYKRNEKELSSILLHKTHLVYWLVLFSYIVNPIVNPPSGM